MLLQIFITVAVIVNAVQQWTVTNLFHILDILWWRLCVLLWSWRQHLKRNQWCTCLFCSRYWAFWIWSWVPVMVMMRSSEPSSGSSILIDAPDSWRICFILWPPFPMMEPASCGANKRPIEWWVKSDTSFSVFPETWVLHLLGWSLVLWRPGLRYRCTSLCCLEKEETFRVNPSSTKEQHKKEESPSGQGTRRRDNINPFPTHQTESAPRKNCCL